MKAYLYLLTLGLATGIGVPTMAASPIDTFSTCMVDTLNGKERKGLAKWIFFSIGAHPEISSFSNATEADLEASDKYVGALITRLLTDDCPEEFRAASESDPKALEKAFTQVGQIAMQELMVDDDVERTIMNYSKHVDMEKIEQVLAKD